jgi:hypothetical protein
VDEVLVGVEGDEVPVRTEPNLSSGAARRKTDSKQLMMK